MRKYGATGRSWLRVERFFVIVVGLMLICCPAGWASTPLPGGDQAPVFTRQGDEIVASLIPRAKSTSVRITFKVSGGDLAGLTARPFEEVARPEVDGKDFKSGLFAIQVTDLPAGGNAMVSITSDFFSSSTEYWIYNGHRAAVWAKAPMENRAHGNMAQELILTVTDGGPLDADNVADGRITLVGGPWDSFWGYALGTLFIRFFGIFLVLSVLMICMLGSGKIFKTLDGRKTPTGRKEGQVEAKPDQTPGSTTAASGDVKTPTGETIAAIFMGLHMHFSQLQGQKTLKLETSGTGAWVQRGRQQAMGACYFSMRKR